MGHRHHPGAGAEEARIGGHVQVGVVLERDGAEHGASVPAHHLPGDEVGVVLHLADDDLVSGLERPAEGLGDDVHALGGAAG
jgi:hypothetical protein